MDRTPCSKLSHGPFSPWDILTKRFSKTPAVSSTPVCNHSPLEVMACQASENTEASLWPLTGKAAQGTPE